MEERINEIAEEFAEIYKRMDWRWETPKFKGVPTKEMIAKHIETDIKLLENKQIDVVHTTSGRIFTMKHITEEPEGKYTEYIIMLNDRRIGEESF